MENQVHDVNVDGLRKKHFCRRCKSELAGHRIARSSVVKTLFFWLPIKRYKCYKCSHKQYILD